MSGAGPDRNFQREAGNRAAIYLRLSKEDADKSDKGDDSESIANQRSLLGDYAAEHGYHVVGIYNDDDYSGLYDDRPEFHRLLRDAGRGKFDIILAKSQARFSRNMEHIERYLHHDLPMLGVRFIGVVDHVDTSLAGNKKARQIYGLTNEWYCEDLSANIRSVFRQKMKDGQFLGGFAPYGYAKDPADKHKLIIDEEAADVVRRIYKLYVQGYGLKHICAILEDDGIDNPTVYKKKKGLNYSNAKSEPLGQRYNMWSETTVRRILKNETYLGTLTQGVCEKLSYKDKKVVAVPRERWVVVENHHEPIIDREIFDQVRELSGKRRLAPARSAGPCRVHALAGKIRCASCGFAMIKSGGVRGRRDDWYMRCQLSNKSRKKLCASHNIRYSLVERAVLLEIKKLARLTLADQEWLRDVAKRLVERGEEMDAVKRRERELRDLEAQADTLLRSIELLYGDLASGKIDGALFEKLKDSFRQQEEKVSRQSELIREELAGLADKTGAGVSAAERISCSWDYAQLTPELAADYVDYVEVCERRREDGSQEIIIHWNF